MKKQKSLIALLVCLALCLISMIGTWCGITDGGNVKVYDLSIDTNKGDVVRFLEYRPKTASAENPVPAIIYSPGNDSTAESVRLTSVELARRGYDVFVLDLLSAGHSSIGVGNSTTFGFQELIDYVYDNLDYIDNAHIGIAGYSKGGGNVVRVMNDYGTQQREAPDHYVRKVDAALIMAPPFSPLGDVAKGINLGFAAGKYDPYSRIGFAPVEGYWPGDLSVKREMKETINFGVPGTFSEADLDNPDVKVEIGHTYGSFSENNARVVYNPADSTHGSGMISRGFIFATVDFFMKAIPAPNPIDANNLTYPFRHAVFRFGAGRLAGNDCACNVAATGYAAFCSAASPGKAAGFGLEYKERLDHFCDGVPGCWFCAAHYGTRYHSADQQNILSDRARHHRQHFCIWCCQQRSSLDDVQRIVPAGYVLPVLQCHP